MRGEGMMTFPDFYPSEHSEDGMMWSFLSREGVSLYRNRFNPKKSVYFKVIILVWVMFNRISICSLFHIGRIFKFFDKRVDALLINNKGRYIVKLRVENFGIQKLRGWKNFGGWKTLKV